MPFTAADYQGMSQERRRRKNPRAQVAQAASQARNQSSRQTPAGSDKMRLDRARPGVPAMPVRGLESGQQQEQVEQPVSAETQETAAGAADTGAGAADAGTGAAGAGMQQFPAGMFPGQQHIVNMLGSFGTPAGGVSIDRVGSSEYQMPGMGQPGSDFPTKFGAEPMEEEEPLGDYVSPTGTDFGMAAGEDEFREGGGIGRLRGRAPGYGETLPGDAPEQSAQDELQEEFDQLMADLEAERESTAAAVNRDLAASQRRQAEINALAGRSIGGGFGGAVATTAVMGAAALEEADRAIRERMTNAQAAWLDGKRQALEREKEREQQKDMLRAQQTHELSVAAAEMGAVSGAGAPATPGATVEGGAPGGTAGAGAVSEDGTSYSDMSMRDFYDEGWRREVGTGRWMKDGEYWDELYPGQPTPFAGTEHFSDMETSVSDYGGGSSGWDNEWEWGSEQGGQINLDQMAGQSAKDYIDDELLESLGITGEDATVEDVLAAYGITDEHDGKSVWDLYWDNTIGLKGLIELTHITRSANKEYLEDTVPGGNIFQNKGDRAWNTLSDNVGEDSYEQAMDDVFYEDVVFSGPGDSSVRGDEIGDLIEELADQMGWWNAEMPDGFGDYDAEDDYASMNVDDDTDKLRMWVMAQPGLLQEIVGWALNERHQGTGTESFAGTSIDRLREHLEQSGRISPRRN